MSQVATILEAVASTFGVSKESILQKYTSINIPKKVQEAKMALIYVLREKASLTFRQIAKETNYVSGGSVNTIYQKAVDLYEQNHAITEKINTKCLNKIKRTFMFL
jgi:chromosomal replication initiation ATPase DnaA